MCQWNDNNGSDVADSTDDDEDSDDSIEFVGVKEVRV